VTLLSTSFVLATGLSAAQLLPTYEYAGLTSRAGGLPLSEVVAESLEPASLIQLLLPHTFEGGAPGFMPEPGVPLFWSIYLGVTPLVLLITALALRPPWFWLAIVFFAVLLTMGSHSVLFPLLYSLAPRLVGAFRYPGKLFLLAHFALAVIAAVGFVRVLESPRSRAAAVIAATILVAFGIAISGAARAAPEGTLLSLGYDLSPGLPPESYEWVALQVAAKGHRLAALALVSGGVIWLFSRARIGTPVFAGLLVLSTFVDLFTVHQPSLVFTEWDSFAREGDDSRVVRPGQRVFHYRRAVEGGLAAWVGTIRIAEPVEEKARALWAARIPDLPVLDGAVVVAGVDGFAPRDRIDFYSVLATLPPEGALRLLAALGTERVAGPDPLDGVAAHLVFSRDDPGLHVYDLPEPAPRSYLAKRASYA
ncbi:MAG: hypothetical protein ACREQ9_11935, partial [Candidatus Binatia bacterium]